MSIEESRSLPLRSILLAAPRGYCAGVDRAVVAVERALELHGAPIYVRKQIVHNKHVVARLIEHGAVFVDELDAVPEGATVVFSAHGVSPAVRADAERRSLSTIDATCPLVTKVHQEAKRFARDDYTIALIGHEGHEEVEGTFGEAPNRTVLIQNPAEAGTVSLEGDVVWLSQTTLSVDETLETVDVLRKRFPLLVDPPSDDICYATQNRQVAVKAVSARSDLVLIVGSKNSSNSRRLVEVALASGAPKAYLIDDVGEVQKDWLDGARTIGVSSGASVPDDLVQDLVTHLSGLGWTNVEEVETAEETIEFSLPKEVRDKPGRRARDDNQDGRWIEI